ncbi:general secretion pathway protein GspK, partial [Verrucomicrobiota bacterium]
MPKLLKGINIMNLECWSSGVMLRQLRKNLFSFQYSNAPILQRYRRFITSHSISKHHRLCGAGRNRDIQGTSSDAASVLILALWTLFFLAALSIAVASIVSADLMLATKLKSRVTTRYLAKAGAERAVMGLLSDTNDWDGLIEVWGDNEEIFRDFNLKEGSFTISRSVVLPYKDDEIRYGLIDEESRININKADLSLLKSLIELAGNITPMEASDIAASIIDWRDGDDEILTGGAENSYYSALSSPYSCHNAQFESIHELLLVKGVVDVLFSKLEQHITIYGSGKININTANSFVLKCVAESCSPE